jgi:hypothetical protein
VEQVTGPVSDAARRELTPEIDQANAGAAPKRDRKSAGRGEPISAQITHEVVEV